jgi:hypothetical protein
MSLPKIIRADFGSDLAIHARYNLSEKLSGFLTLVRPIFAHDLFKCRQCHTRIRGLPSWDLCVSPVLAATHFQPVY